MHAHIRRCARCDRLYDWRRSPSTFQKMTYCGSLCERAALGFTLDALFQEFEVVPSPKGTQPYLPLVA